MSNFKTLDFQNYEESLWQEPNATKQTLWHEPANRYGSIPEPLYRLRVSVLNNDQGRDDCPLRMFVYPTLECLKSATTAINDTFGGAFPKCKIQMGGIEGRGAKTTDEQMMAGMDDGRTESCVLRFETQSADETWAQFLKRLNNLEERWTLDSGEAEA